MAIILLTLGLWAVACGRNPLAEQPDERDVIASGKVLGVCFMHGDLCGSTYVDLGPYFEDEPMFKSQTQEAVYIFPSTALNPLDSLRQYRPFRLQNNIFAGEALTWRMVMVYSLGTELMAEPTPGSTIWGVEADTTGERFRDLHRYPILGEEELLVMEQEGQVRLEDTGMLTDCPIVRALPEDVVVNLNPDLPICED